MLLTVEDVAAKLKVSKHLVYKLIRTKKMPIHKISERCIRIDE